MQFVCDLAASLGLEFHCEAIDLPPGNTEQEARNARRAFFSRLIAEGLVDRIAVCVAPKILGEGIEAIGDLGIRDLSRSLILTDVAVEPYGVDLILSGRIEYPDGVLDRG